VLAQCRHSRSCSLKNKRTDIAEKCCPEPVEGSFSEGRFIYFILNE